MADTLGEMRRRCRAGAGESSQLPGLGVRARQYTSTWRAPALINKRARLWAVAPVVSTSSTSARCWPGNLDAGGQGEGVEQVAFAGLGIKVLLRHGFMGAQQQVFIHGNI